jgi:hypothetical protein
LDVKSSVSHTFRHKLLLDNSVEINVDVWNMLKDSSNKCSLFLDAKKQPKHLDSVRSGRVHPVTSRTRDGSTDRQHRAG